MVLSRYPRDIVPKGLCEYHDSQVLGSSPAVAGALLHYATLKGSEILRSSPGVTGTLCHMDTKPRGL
jgi:hypothetical protein